LKAKCIEWDRCNDEQQRYHKRWVAITKQMKVRLSKQNGGQLTGDGCYRFLAQQQHLASIMTPIGNVEWNGTNERWCNKFMKLVSDLFLIYQYIMRPTPLCDHEIIRVWILAEEYIWQWYYLFGRFTPKLHVLAYHLPQFLMKHRTVSHSQALLTLLSLYGIHTGGNVFRTKLRTST
jgi:hypothetical protein